jgi:hypothetical protein
VPFGNSVEKSAAMRALGAELIEHGGEAGAGFLGEGRQVLPTDRALRIVAVHQLDHVRRDRHGELAVHRLIDVLDIVQNTVQFAVVGIAPSELFLPRFRRRIIGIQIFAAEQFVVDVELDGLQHEILLFGVFDDIPSKITVWRQFRRRPRRPKLTKCRKCRVKFGHID